MNTFRPKNLRELIERGTRRAKVVALLGIFVTASICFGVLFAMESNRLSNDLERWSELSHRRIAEALFVENSTAVQGIVGAHLESDKTLGAVRITVVDTKEKVVFTNEGNRPTAMGLVARFGAFLGFERTFETKLIFASADVGLLRLSSTLELNHLGLIFSLSLLLAFLVWRIQDMVLSGFAQVVSLSIVQPLRKLVEEIAESARSNFSVPVIAQEDLLDELKELSESMRRMATAQVELTKERDRSARAESRSELASQVAHDIRSPLTALNVVMQDLEGIPEERRILARNAINRINDIANHLLLSKVKVSSEENPKAEPQLLTALVESLISEKRLQFRSKIGIDIDSELGPESYGLFVMADPVELKRVLSNIVNNAVEAIASTGTIRIGLRASGSMIEMKVSDSGTGIEPDVLKKLGEKGYSVGKSGESGYGLGLFHARTTIEKWNGTLCIESQLGVGTNVMVNLPRVNAPKWFVERLEYTANAVVIVLDDDFSIHQVWTNRFQGLEVELKHFSRPHQLKAWVQNNSTVNCWFLIDFEFLGFPENGLDVIEDLRIGPKSILVTSRYDESRVRERSDSLGIKRLPKGLAGVVPVVITERASPMSLDAVLIDDDPFVHDTWKLRARLSGKSLTCFSDPTEMRSTLHSIPRETEIYVDVSLGDSVKGDEFAKELHDLGFKQIYLATGYEASDFAHLKFLSGIRDKTPPW